MQSLKHKNMHQQWFEEQIVQGKNLISNPVQKKIQQNLQKKSNKKFQHIPRYSSQKLKQIQLQILNLKSVELSIMETNQYVQSIISLMCWVWQSESFEYKSQKTQKKTKKNQQNQEEIDCSKSIRKLFQFYNKNHQIFDQTIFLGRDIIQKNGIKTKIVKNQEKGSKSSKVFNQKDSFQIKNSQEILTGKNYIIYETYKNLEKHKKNDEQFSLITLLLEIIVLSYDRIVLLDINIATSAITRFSFVNMKNNIKNESYLKQRILQQLALFTFSQLHYIKIGQASNQQSINSISRKRGSQQILWKFFANLTKIINFQMNQKSFLNFHQKTLQILKTAHILVSQITHYMKKVGAQIKQVKLKDLEQFFQIFIQRTIEVQFFLFQIRQSKSNEKISSQQDEIWNYKFELLLFDWALLVIKNDENKLFKKVMKICKKRLFKSIQEKNIDSKERAIINYRANEGYNQFVIKQDPNQFSEGKSITQEKQFFDRKSQEQIHQNPQIDHAKIKTFLSVPYMKLLTFKEHVPLSVKRRQDKKIQSKKQSQDDCLIYLLILYNRQYIIQLLQQIQFIQVQQLDLDISKGLVKLCTYCNKFTSLILSERYFKILSSKPHYHNLLQSVFDKDIDYQRRLSQSRLSYHSTNKSLSSNEIQSSYQYESKIIQKTQTTQQDEILKVRLKSCESIFFQMITEVQSKIPLLKISTYLDEALKKPQIFRAQVFYHKLLQYQHPSYGREYLTQLIIRWIDHELRFFNILTYFEIFFKNCLFSQSQEGQLSLLIEGLPISKLIKLHCLLLTETFAQHTTIKVSSPQGVSPFEKIQLLTSGGFEEKCRLIDKSFNGMSQIILWNKYLKLLSPIQKSQKYVYIKSYFTLIFYSFSGNQNWNKSEQKFVFLIEKLKIDIQKDRVDEVCSIFHFLSLALFPNKSLVNPSVVDLDFRNDESESLSFKMRSQQNARQKIIEQIFYIIRQNSKKIIDMYKNKESLTIKYLTEDIRRKTTNDINSDMDDMKRKQVAKMLNKQKLMHDYLIKTIVRFLQSVQYTQSFLKNFHSPEQFINISAQICKRQYLGHENKIFQTEKALYTPKLNYFLSSVSSANQFQLNFKKQLKRFQQNLEKHHNRYAFIVMVRFIAQKWIQQKSQPVKVAPSQKIKSKNTKSSKSSTVDNRSKQKSSSITNLLSIQSIFKICLSVIQIRFESSVLVRQSEVLKQKMICLQTICLLSNFIIENSVSLQSSNSSLLKSYLTNFHQKLSQILIKLLMNNEVILGKNERELILHIRLQALSHMIQNYAYNNQYDKYEWRLMKDRKSFWFLINCLIFDKAGELRFFIIKNALSRFSSSKEFRAAKGQKMLIMQLMIAEEPVKQLSQLAKKTLIQTFQYSLTVNTSKGIDLLLNSLMECVEFVTNFNLINLLQKNQKKINQKEFFQILIEILFEKNQMQAYFFALVQSFKALLNCKSGNQLIKILQPLDWDFAVNIDFYLTSKSRVNKHNFSEKEKQQNKKVYLQLLQQLKEETWSQSQHRKQLYNIQKNIKKKSKADSRRIQQYQIKFFQLLLQTLKSIEEVFKLKYARLNKKYAKTKKAMYQLFHTPLVPNLSLFLNQTFQRQEKNNSGRNIRQSQEEIQI